MQYTGNKKALILGTVFVLVIAITIAAIMITGNKDDEVNPSNSPTGTNVVKIEGTELKSLENIEGKNGDWTSEDGLKGEGRGDCFAMSETTAKDFIFEAKVNILSGDAASIVFRSNESGNNAYVANVDLGQNNARIFKFTGNGAVTLGEFKLADTSVTEYTIRVEAIGSSMKYILNGVPVINCSDSEFEEGILGLLLCNSEVVFSDVRYTLIDENTPKINGVTLGSTEIYPGFSENVYTYSATVPFETDKITLDVNSAYYVSVGAFFKKSVVTLDNTKTDGKAEIPLVEGENIIVVNSQNGLSTQINVKRKTDPEKYYTEAYRPQFHVTPESGWLNDPNGMVFYKGEYHLFYQYFPDSKFPADIKYWAHVKSPDLVHWQECPVAISPDQNGSIWSGSAVVDFNNSSGLFNDTPDKTGLVAFYTAVTGGSDHQQQSMAYSTDNGMTWIKYNDGLPIITNDDDPLHNREFRDPKVFWHEESGRWMMVVAGGPLRFFSSDDLINWEPEGMQDDIHTECPDFFKLSVDDSDVEKWVLSCGGVNYMIGDFEEVDGVWKFIPDSMVRYPFNYGPDVYASQTFSDTPGRRIKVDWMTNISYPFENGQITDPWNGALTIPYDMKLKTVSGKIKLVQYPVAELDSLHKAEYKFDGIEVNDETVNPLKDLSLDMFEIRATIDIGTATEVGFKVRVGTGENGEEQYTLIRYRASSNSVAVDRSDSGRSPKDGFLKTYSTRADLVDGKLDLQIMVDWSSVEAFAEGGAYPFTVLVYPNPESKGLEMYATGGTAKVEKLSVFELGTIYR